MDFVALHAGDFAPRRDVPGTDAGHGQVVVILGDHAHAPVAAPPDALEADIPLDERLPVREASHPQQRAPAVPELPHRGQIVAIGALAVVGDAQRIANVLRIVAVPVVNFTESP